MRKNTIVVGAGIVGVAVLVSLAPVGATPPETKGGPAQTVTVNNSSINPVPVSAQQAGPWTVGLSGTPAVSLSGTPTVNVADAREPFQARASAFGDSDDFGTTASFSVPAGKRLVVEFLSASASIPPSQSAVVSVDGGAYIPMQPQGVQATSAGTFATSIGAVSLLEFHPAGSTVSVHLERARTDFYNGTVPGVMYLSVFVSGYLLPA